MSAAPDGAEQPAQRYHRIGKIFMLQLTSDEMKKRLWDILNVCLHGPRGIQTTSITVHEEGKTDRGALKAVSREKLADGSFRIILPVRLLERQLRRSGGRVAQEALGADSGLRGRCPLNSPLIFSVS